MKLMLKFLVAGGLLCVFGFFLLTGKLPMFETDFAKKMTSKDMSNSPTKASFDWKSVNLFSEMVPNSANDVRKLVEIKTGTIKVKVPPHKEGIDVFYSSAEPPDGIIVMNQTVLLLHGRSFNTDTWLNLGTLHLLPALGRRVVSVDLPVNITSGKNVTFLKNEGGRAMIHIIGRYLDVLVCTIQSAYGGGVRYGNTKQKFDGDKVAFISYLVEHLSLADIPLVIVSPSMSGEYSVPFVTSHWQSLAGYIPVAPVASGSVTQGALSKVGIPTLILHGDNDKTGLAESSLENLKVIPKSKKVEFKGAGHACYLDKPNLFHQMLYNFLTLLSIHS
uniref:Uncharacterized protein n=1 Tax=Timema tahoe TaxID=61484 RepID=A0A7R9IKI5_9NEOP|nr:unnamed protein product [Timema tahoe]